MPGCGSTVGLAAHHVRAWSWGGKTVLANWSLLCRAHHHAVHADQFSIQPLGNQRFRFHRLDGSELPGHLDPAPLTTGPPIEHQHAHVASDAATTGWDGTHLDRDWAIAVLAQRLNSTERRLAADRPAPPTIPFEQWIA